MPRLTLIEISKYREWTEELDSDREGLVQIKQSTIYRNLQEVFWNKNCFVLPFRYDYYIVLSNGLSEEDLRNIVEQVRDTTPYGVRTVSIVHKYPVSALLKATSIIRRKEFYYEESIEDEIVVSHIDLNNITEYALETSIYESYIEILAINYYISKQVMSIGGITSYLGGDNLIAILPVDRYIDLIDIMPSYLKIGIGISKIPRKAVELSTKALTSIRKGLVNKNYYVLYDNV